MSRPISILYIKTLLLLMKFHLPYTKYYTVIMLNILKRFNLIPLTLLCGNKFYLVQHNIYFLEIVDIN